METEDNNTGPRLNNRKTNWTRESTRRSIQRSRTVLKKSRIIDFLPRSFVQLHGPKPLEGLLHIFPITRS
ncbi:unnamed protein product [Calypogeia fissa]